MELSLPSESGELYEKDYYAWTQEQAKFLRDGKWNCLDASNLADEIETLGKQERRELENRLGILLGHLLKWEFQSDKRSKSWFATIREPRRQILKLLNQSPSLKPYLPEALEEAYQNALDLAVRETSLSYKDFPQQCPYELAQTVDASFFPGQQLESDCDW